MRHIIIIIAVLASVGGCGGLSRLSRYAKEGDIQQKAEKIQRAQYKNLKETLQTQTNVTFSDVVRKFGQPILTRNDYGQKTAVYKDGFTFCAETLYLTVDDQGKVSAYETVEPCKKPQ